MPIGPGGYDPQGVWLYGEADENPMASDLLNRLGSSVSTQLGLVRADVTNLQDPPDTDWRNVMASTTPTVPAGYTKYATGWVPGTSTRFQPLAHRVRDGHVYLTGVANTTGDIVQDTVIFTLPVGMRPSRTVSAYATIFPNSTFVVINTDGTVVVGQNLTMTGTKVLVLSTNFPAAL